MANANAIIIRKPKLYKIPTSSNLAHNSGISPATYWLFDSKSILQNIKFNDRKEIDDLWKKWEEEAKIRYKNNPLHKRSLKSNAVIIEEGLIVFGSHVEFESSKITIIINEFLNKFQKDNNTKVLHVAYHNHEGHLDLNGQYIINRHAHFLFDNVDNNGVMVRRNWKREYLKQLQDDIYLISKKYIPNIERAREAEYKETYIDGKLVRINQRKHKHHRVYREMHKNENIKMKILLANEQKKEAVISDQNKYKKENSDLLYQNSILEAKIKELNEQVYSDKKYKNKDMFVPYKKLTEHYKKINEEKSITIENYEQILNKLEDLKSKIKIQNGMDLKITDFFELIVEKIKTNEENKLVEKNKNLSIKEEEKYDKNGNYEYGIKYLNP